MDIVNGFQLCDAHYRRTGFQGKYIVGNLNLKWKWKWKWNIVIVIVMLVIICNEGPILNNKQFINLVGMNYM